MKLLVLSDSHGNSRAISNVLSAQTGGLAPDAIIFLGDGIADVARLDTGGIPVYSVSGNCDFSSFSGDNAPYERLVCFESFIFLIMHGHKFGVKYGYMRAASYAASRHADVLLFGHTHTSYEGCLSPGSYEVGNNYSFSLEKPLFLFNPGSIGEYNGSWGIIEIKGDDIMFSHGGSY